MSGNYLELLNIYKNCKESLLLVKNKRIEKIGKNLRRGWKKKKNTFRAFASRAKNPTFGWLQKWGYAIVSASISNFQQIRKFYQAEGQEVCI